MTELSDKPGIAPATHSCVQVDDVEEGILSKSVEQAKNVFNCQSQFAAVDQLDRAAVLEIDAGDDQSGSV